MLTSLATILTFTEWTTVSGVRLPTARTVTKGGKESTEGPWTAELLAEPPANAFQRP